MEQATDLSPDMKEIIRAREMLRDLCPNMFDGQEIPPEFLVNRTSTYVRPDEQGSRENSPVCVVAQAHDSPRTRRKRSRCSAEETCTYRSNS